MKRQENVNLKPSSPVEIRSLSHDGRGIAMIDSKTTFVAGGLPNEIVTLNVTQKHRHYLEAEALEIIAPSAERVTPPCQHFGVCGGCSLQHMSEATQLALKQQTLLNQLEHFGKVIPEEILPPLHALTLGYRRKARLGVKFVIKKNKLLVGFREKSSRYLADLERCVILHPKVGNQLNGLSQLIRSLEAYRHIPQVEVAIGDSDVALVFRHLEPLSVSDKEKLIAFGKQSQLHIYLQPNLPSQVHKIGSPTEKTEKAEKKAAHLTHELLSYTLPEEKLAFLFHPLDFTQINLEINRLMVQQAMTLLALNPHETALDLFCGLGNFTLPMARRALQVTGVEGGETMIARAKLNAEHNHIENVDYYIANLEKPDREATWARRQYDKILLDPPRVGAKEILPLIPQFGAKRIVYVSCNPATLARDAGELVHTYHYRLKKVGMMNMFPHTSHIEGMAVFDKEE